MNIFTKLLLTFVILIIIYTFFSKKENFKAIFKNRLVLEKDVDLKNVSLDMNIEQKKLLAEKICLYSDDGDEECINKNELEKIIKFPKHFKQSVCLGENCSLKKQLVYLDRLWPVGSIVAFQGRKSDLPEGWRVCDGQNHLPDLRNRFIKGNNIDEIGTIDDRGEGFGVRGGEDNVTLDIKETPRHYHFFNINDIRQKGNTTGVGSFYAILDGKDKNDVLYREGNAWPQPAWNRRSKGLKGRKVDVDILTPYYIAPTSDYGNSKPHNNLPPYYTLMYIIRVDERNFDNENYFIYKLLNEQLK